MANDLSDILRQTATKALQDALGGGEQEKPKSGAMGAGKGLLAGAALAAAAPLARKGLEAARSGELQDLASQLGTGQALEDVRARFNSDDDEGGEEAGDGRDDPEASEDAESGEQDEQDDDR